MSRRYLAPTFSVKINGTGLEADVSRNILDVSVVNEPDSLGSFNLTIANPYPEMRWTHTADADLFREGNSITIALGYVDDLHPGLDDALPPMLDGEITAISPTFPESGAPTLQVEGLSRLHRLKGSVKTRTFQNVTDTEIVQRIAQDVELTMEAENTTVKHPYIIQDNKTDLEFLLKRAKDIHFEILVRGKTLIFRRALGTASKTYTLVWGKTLKSFNPRLDARNQIQSVSVRGYDPMTKQKIVGRAGAGDEATPVAGTQTGAQVARRAFGSSIDHVHIDAPVASQAEADQRARAIYNDRVRRLVGGSGSSIGLPDLRAGQWIELQGLGPRFSGLYYLTQTTHTFNSGGYQTNFDAERPNVG